MLYDHANPTFKGARFPVIHILESYPRISDTNRLYARYKLEQHIVAIEQNSTILQIKTGTLLISNYSYDLKITTPRVFVSFGFFILLKNHDIMWWPGMSHGFGQVAMHQTTESLHVRFQRTEPKSQYELNHTDSYSREPLFL